MSAESLVNDGSVRTSLSGDGGPRSVDEIGRNGAATLSVDDVVEIQRQILNQFAASREKQAREPEGRAEPRTATAIPGDSAVVQSSEFDAMDALDDEEFILDQKRILEQIQRESQTKRDAQARSTQAAVVPRWENSAEVQYPTPPSSRSRTHTYNGFAASRFALEGSLCPLLRDWDVMDANEASLDSSDSFTRLSSGPEDSARHVSKGRKLRLKGARHVYKAIENGTSTLVQCFNCRTSLHVPQACTAVYCAVCHQVTPMDLARTSASGASTLNDSEIAEALQRQELDVALARTESVRRRQLPPRDST
jgi:LSD1 subclass zinc finger protein